MACRYYFKKRYYPKKKGYRSSYRRHPRFHGGGGPVMKSEVAYLTTLCNHKLQAYKSYMLYDTIITPDENLTWISGIKISGVWRNPWSTFCTVLIHVIQSWASLPSPRQDSTTLPSGLYHRDSMLRCPCLNPEKGRLVGEARMNLMPGQLISRKLWFRVGWKFVYTQTGGQGPRPNFYFLMHVVRCAINPLTFEGAVQFVY